MMTIIDNAVMKQELAALFNRHNAENMSGTPDFVLAEVAFDAVMAFDKAVHMRGDFRGERVEFIPN